MDNILQIVRQESLEKRFSKHNIDRYIREAMDIDVNKVKIDMGIELLKQWLSNSYYDSKNARLEQIKLLDIGKLVKDLFVGIAYIQKPELFTSVTSQLASRLGFDDKRAAIQTVAEVLSVLCITDAFDIIKEDKMSPLMIVNTLYIPSNTLKFIEESAYLPPMVCEPLELSNNYDSGYLSIKESLILGKGNHHDGNICIDVLNTMNKGALKLDFSFLCAVEEDPTFELDTAEKRDMWLAFKKESQMMYLLMHETGNEFYLTHKVDKRGRIYASGYHISTQGTAYKKAMLELAEEELVDGV